MAHHITPSAPRLRGDLIIRRQQTPDGVMVVIKEPRSGEFYRLREVEDFILRQLDGTTSLEEVRRRVESHFGGALADNSIPLFVCSARGGLLGPTRATRGKSTHGRLVGPYLRMSLFDPTRLFDWLPPGALTLHAVVRRARRHHDLPGPGDARRQLGRIHAGCS
jgi:hypothetical protein